MGSGLLQWWGRLAKLLITPFTKAKTIIMLSLDGMISYAFNAITMIIMNPSSIYWYRLQKPTLYSVSKDSVWGQGHCNDNNQSSIVWSLISITKQTKTHKNNKLLLERYRMGSRSFQWSQSFMDLLISITHKNNTMLMQSNLLCVLIHAQSRKIPYGVTVTVMIIPQPSVHFVVSLGGHRRLYVHILIRWRYT